jgi:hypothetical protein
MATWLEGKTALLNGGRSSIDLATSPLEQGGKDGYETRDNSR